MKTYIGLALLGTATLQPGAGLAPVAAQSTATTPQLRIVPDLARTSKTRSSGPKSAYLLVYFKDEDHSLHFATSRDGYSFTDVNGVDAVLSGRDIADQKGIRDPYIMRGPDGAFYMAMTDLHIFAKREGLRATDWERPREQFSWGNNRNMLFMRSYDLIHWTLSKVNISGLFPAFADAGCAWAPEMIVDPASRRLMVYFTTRHGVGPNVLVYSHADPAFTTLTSEPRTLFSYPNPKVNVLDADITRVGNRYRMFYVAHDKPGNIRQAVSNRMEGGYVYDPAKADPEEKSAEAPNLWKRYGKKKYVLMYDVFGVKPNNMGFAETEDFKNFRNIGRFNDPGSPMKATNFRQPKHGAVIPVTAGEVKRLEDFFHRGK